MVRVPTKTCPNLHRILAEAPADLLSGFLASRQFEKLSWLDQYRFDPDDRTGGDRATQMLVDEPKARLLPLESEAARVLNIAGTRGQFVLEGLVREDSDQQLGRAFLNQSDELARSLWCWLTCMQLFEAAESVLHLRLYRRYDRHYQTFLAAPTGEDDRDVGSQVLGEFVKELQEGLQRGSGCVTDRFDIPAEGDEPAAEMYLIRHPNLPTAAREIDEEGRVAKFYFRPPGEAMVVYTPSTGRVHVRAGTRAIRHLVWKAFVSKALGQNPSHQPADFQAYDISRFLTDFELPVPDDPEAVIKRVVVIRIEASIGNLSNRLAISTTIGQSVKDLINSLPGLDGSFAKAVAIRFVEIAVRYRRKGSKEDETLDFTISDQNTSSLLSLDDPFERVLGHRLLRAWGIMVDGRAPAETDLPIVLPAIMALWNIGADRVAGSWLITRNLDAAPMIDHGFLVPMGWEDGVVIDEEEGVGSQDARVDVGPEAVNVVFADGQAAPAGHPEAYRLFRVRQEWVAEYLKPNIAVQFGSKTLEVVTPNLLALGTLDVSERHVPVYLARRLEDERLHADTDTALRARSDLGTGLVLNAGRRAGFALTGNVLVSLADYLSVDGQGPVIDLAGLRAAYLRHRNLARGGETVELELTGPNAGTLFVPGKGSIEIGGENRLVVIGRLVDAFKTKRGPMKTEDMKQGFDDQSLANIFGKELWDKLKADFLRSTRKGFWEIAA